MAVDIDQLAGPDGGEEGQRLAKFWRSQIEKVRDDPHNKRWIKRGETIEKRYRDERSRVDEEGQRRYNALWSNVEILTPAIYGKCPVPIAERRFRDKDPTGRGAAQILERGLRNEIEICGFHDSVSQAVRDYLLPGRGVVWVRYEPEFEEGVSVVTDGELDITDNQGEIEPDEAEDTQREGDETEGGTDEAGGEEDQAYEETEKLRQTGDRIVRESCPVDYINWKDFMVFPANARVWKEVTAICKRVYMTRDQMRRRFGNTIGKDVPLKKDDRNVGKWDGPDMDPQDKGEVFEIWSLTDKQVFWVAEGYSWLLDRKDDPLELENFFPVPRPLFSNTTNGTIYPVADYIEYQDQAIQIDELTQRIAMLTKACKVAGVYNAAAKDIQRLLNESVENELIPVDDWAAFAEEGGVAGNISLLPLKEIIGVINELIMVKAKCVEEMDRLTGITDIMRGTTDARETLGGQRLKTNSAGTRLQYRQNEVARFCRDTVRIIADIMGQHFSDQSLIEVSGCMYEEGLGDVDPDTLTQKELAQFNPPQAIGGGQPPPLSLPAPAPNGVSNQPPVPQGVGGNVVPFHQAGGKGQMPMPPPAPQPQMSPDMIAQIIGMQRIKGALDLIRNEKLRGFRVDIEVDSTIFGDAQQEKGDRTQFITAVTQYLQQALMMSSQVPEITPLLGKFLQFGVRGFRVGRDLEAAIEDFCDEAVAIAKAKAQQASQTPTPQQIGAQAQMIKAQATAKGTDAKIQTDRAKLQLEAHKTGAKVQSDREKAQAEVVRQQQENEGERQNAQMEMMKQHNEAKMQQDQHAADMQSKNMDLYMKQLEIQLEQMRMHFEEMKMARQAAQGPGMSAGEE